MHFWPEVLLPGGDWLVIEPTPGYELPEPNVLLSDRISKVASNFARVGDRSCDRAHVYFVCCCGRVFPPADIARFHCGSVVVVVSGEELGRTGPACGLVTGTPRALGRQSKTRRANTRRMAARDWTARYRTHAIGEIRGVGDLRAWIDSAVAGR